jgi:translation initiation factor 3 subunit B
MESGYALWDFKGGELQKHTQDKFKQLLWRPRPPTLLSKEDQKRIRKNLRDYSRAFDEADELEESNVSAELIALRKRLIEEWNSWRGHSKENMERNRIDQGKAPKESLVRSQQALVAEEVIEEWQEVIISETTELITA